MHGWSSIEQSPYLKPGRLADLLAAIQTMALYARYRRPAEDWAHLIAGDKAQASHWKALFEDHPEFFRPSTAFPGHYALVWRRAGTPIDYTTEKGEKRRSRPMVPEGQIKTLLDTAINLHQRAVDAHRDRRWWITPSTAVICALIGAVVGAIIKAH